MKSMRYPVISGISAAGPLGLTGRGSKHFVPMKGCGTRGGGKDLNELLTSANV